MDNFQLPEDLSSLSGEELSGLLDSAKTQFNALYESEDISNEALETMEQFANSIEDIVAEQDRRTSAASKRTELSNKANATKAVTAPVEAAQADTPQAVTEGTAVAGSSWYNADNAGSSWHNDSK